MPIFRRSLFLLVIIALMGFNSPSLLGQAADSTKSALNNQDVMEMVKTGLSPEIILAKIKAGPCNFETSPAALKELKSSGVPDNLVLAMVEASAPAKEAGTVEPNAKPAGSLESAHLRVYRQHRFSGSALAPSIYVDDVQVARMGNGRRCSIRLSLGAHTIRSDDKSSAISIEAKGGQEYFVRVDEETGFWKGHGKLTMLPIEQGGPEYKLQKPVEEDRKITRDMIEADTSEPESK